MADHDPFFADDTPEQGDGGVQPRGHFNGTDHDHLGSMRLPDLRAMADTLGLDSTGKRDVLIGRIRDHQQHLPS